MARMSQGEMALCFDKWVDMVAGEHAERETLVQSTEVLERERRRLMELEEEHTSSKAALEGELQQHRETLAQHQAESTAAHRRVQELEELCAALETAHAEALRCQVPESSQS